MTRDELERLRDEASRESRDVEEPLAAARMKIQDD